MHNAGVSPAEQMTRLDCIERRGFLVHGHEVE